MIKKKQIALQSVELERQNITTNGRSVARQNLFLFFSLKARGFSLDLSL